MLRLLLVAACLSMAHALPTSESPSTVLQSEHEAEDEAEDERIELEMARNDSLAQNVSASFLCGKGCQCRRSRCNGYPKTAYFGYYETWGGDTYGCTKSECCGSSNRCMSG